MSFQPRMTGAFFSGLSLNQSKSIMISMPRNTAKQKHLHCAPPEAQFCNVCWPDSGIPKSKFKLPNMKLEMVILMICFKVSFQGYTNTL